VTGPGRLLAQSLGRGLEEHVHVSRPALRLDETLGQADGRGPRASGDARLA
jgi:hypothetical protein